MTTRSSSIPPWFPASGSRLLLAMLFTLNNLSVVWGQCDISISIPSPICVGGQSEIEVAPENPSNFNGYLWQYNNSGSWSNFTNGLPAGAQYSLNASGSALTVSSINANGTYFYRCILTGGPNCANDTIEAAGLSVVPDPSPPSMTKIPTDLSVCEGRSLTAIASPGNGGAGTCSVEFLLNGNWEPNAPNFPAIVGNNNITARTICSGDGCISNTASVNWTGVEDPEPPNFLANSSPTSGSTVCVGATLSAGTPQGGNPGVGCSFQYQFERNGVPVLPWPNSNSTYTTQPGDANSTITVKVRRWPCEVGCDLMDPFNFLASWEVVPDPSPPQLTKDPNVDSICIGTPLTVTFTGGSGGAGNCSDQYRVNNGQWQIIPSSSSITITPSAAGTINIQARRSCNGEHCSSPQPPVDSVRWFAVPVAQAPTQLGPSQPATGTAICVGRTLIAGVPSGGNPGLGCLFEYQFLRDGVTISDWGPDNTYMTTTADANKTISVRVRRAMCKEGCDSPNPNNALASWPVKPDPTNPDKLGQIDPIDKSFVCVGQVLSVGSPLNGEEGVGCKFQYRFYRNGSEIANENWKDSGTYTTTAADVDKTISVRVRRGDCAQGSGCNVDDPLSPLASWTVRKQPDLKLLAADTVAICLQDFIQFPSVSNDGGVNPSFQWQYQGAGGVWSNVQNGIPSGAVYSNPGQASNFQVDNIALAGTYRYRLVMSDPAPGCNTDISETFRLHVRKKLNAGFTITGVGKVNDTGTVTLSDSILPGEKVRLLVKRDGKLEPDNIVVDSQAFSFLVPSYAQGGATDFCIAKTYEVAPACPDTICDGKYQVKNSGSLEIESFSNANSGVLCDGIEFVDSLKITPGTDFTKGSVSITLSYSIKQGNQEFKKDTTIMNVETTGKKYFIVFRNSGIPKNQAGCYEILISAVQMADNGKFSLPNQTRKILRLPGISPLHPDSISIAPKDIASSNDLKLNDAILCPNETYIVKAGYSFDSCGVMVKAGNFKFGKLGGGNQSADQLQYEDNTTGNFPFLMTYDLTGGCNYKDTFHLERKPSRNLQMDSIISICMDSSIQLKVDTDLKDVKWFAFGSTDTLTGTTISPPVKTGATSFSEQWRVKAKDNDCRYSDEFKLAFVKVRGRIEPFPDSCAVGFYRVWVDSFVKASIPPSLPLGWELEFYSPYFFRVIKSAGSGNGQPLKIRISANKSGLGCSEDLLLPPGAAAGVEEQPLLHELCVNAVLAPSSCQAGTWYRIHKVTGVMEILTNENHPAYLGDVSKTSADEHLYIFHCRDECQQVGVLREAVDPPTIPCDDEQAMTLRVWPNPSAGDLTVEVGHFRTAAITLRWLDVLGRTVREEMLQHPGGVIQLPFSMAGRGSGVHVLQLTDEAGHSLHTKVLIQQ